MASGSLGRKRKKQPASVSVSSLRSEVEQELNIPSKAKDLLHGLKDFDLRSAVSAGEEVDQSILQ